MYIYSHILHIYPNSHVSDGHIDMFPVRRDSFPVLDREKQEFQGSSACWVFDIISGSGNQ